MKTKLTTIDFETKEIENRPSYPPEPVGCAVTESSGKTYYMSWGHPCNNNTTKTKAIKILKGYYRTDTIICHNGKFDLEVGEKFMDLPLLPKHGFEDSMLLAFLHNPREKNLKLKILADKYLSMAPDEQTKLREWVFDNVPNAKKAKTKWGKYIYLTPAELAGKYAKGDTIRTKKLFTLFYKYAKDNDMLEQYEVEKRCAIESIYMERTGIRIDERELGPELLKAEKRLKRASNAITKTLGDINLNSAPQKIEAFERLGLVDEWEYGEPTSTGQVNPKTGIESLMRVCTDVKLVSNLEIYSKYSKLVGTYMKPWLSSARENKGLFYPWFNTIKGDNDKGTYTGRMSSNFQQVPRRPNEVFKGMPFLRKFIMPDRIDHVLLARDFMGQEVRILAHFGDGTLLIAFNEDPFLDGHEFIRKLIFDVTGTDYPRDYIKGCNFLIVYGGGAPALSKTINVSEDEARQVLGAYNTAIPEVNELKDELRLLYRRGGEFITAGGRIYDFESGKEYIALNTLIQGSAADHTKRSMLNIIDSINSNNHDARIILPIHDEFLLSANRPKQKSIMKDFKTSMETDKLFDVPMLTDGKVGERWGLMNKYND